MDIQWRGIKISFILVSLSFGVISFLLPIYSKEMGLSATQIGGMFSVFSFVLLIIKPLIGRWTDKIGWKWFLVVAMGLYGVAFYLLAGATSSWMLYIVRMTQAIGSAFLSIASYSMVVALSGEGEVGKQLGKVQSTQSLGMMIGTTVSITVFFNMPFFEAWHKLFVFFAVMAAVGGLIICLRVKDNVKVPTSKDKIKLKIKYSKPLIGMFLITFIFALCSSMLSPILMVYLQDYFTKDLMQLSWAFFPSAMIYIVLGSKLGYLGDRYGYKKMMVIGTLMNCMVAFLIPFTAFLIPLSILWCIDAIGDIIEGTSKSAFLAQIVEEDMRGRVYGICGSIGSLGAMIGPIFGGVLYDKISVHVPFYINGVGCLIVCALIFLLLGKEKQVYENEVHLI